MLKGNKGEWSETYVLLKLLAEGRLYAADENLQKLPHLYFPLLGIIREELPGTIVEYKHADTIEIYVNGILRKSMNKSSVAAEAHNLLSEINRAKSTSFAIEQTETFLHNIYCYRIKASGRDKKDITLHILDINTGHSPIVGFSIKSELGHPPTLLNAGKTTNFIYKLSNAGACLCEEANSIYKLESDKAHIDVRGRIQHLRAAQTEFSYANMVNQIFKNNLILIDSSLDLMLAQTLLYYYRDGIVKCTDLVKELERLNPLQYGNPSAYAYKFKKFLAAVALGMKPATEWSGQDEANGGFIVVTRTGDVLAYHLYNRNFFEDYLLNNTKYETASTTRHDFARVYTHNYQTYINLNLQIRFCK